MKVVLLSFFAVVLFLAWSAWADVKIYEKGRYRYIVSDGLPDHPTGKFPNSGNPHSIEKQSESFRVPLTPVEAARTTPISHNLFGVAINGVPFDPATAEYWNNDRALGWNYDALGGKINLGIDENHAHVQPDGAYHYHGLPSGLLTELGWQQGIHSPLIGYAADGFPIYAVYAYTDPNSPEVGVKKMKTRYLLKEGMRPKPPEGPGGPYDGSYNQDWEYVPEAPGDLDVCNGRFGITPEYPTGTYYYVLTDTYPYIPRCWKGMPDESFRKGPPVGERGVRRPGEDDDRRRPRRPGSQEESTWPDGEIDHRPPHEGPGHRHPHPWEFSN